MTAMFRQVLGVFLLLTLVTGVAYPVLVTLVGHLAFQGPATGSVIERDGRPLGSALLGQPFSSPAYFWSRPSATLPQPFNGAASAGSNHAATNPALLATVALRIEALHAADPDQHMPVPVDLITASGSGLDPHISPAAAEYQVARVARARGRTEHEVRALVDLNTEGRTLGLLGEPRVNVVRLNLALDSRPR